MVLVAWRSLASSPESFVDDPGVDEPAEAIEFEEEEVKTAGGVGCRQVPIVDTRFHNDSWL